MNGANEVGDKKNLVLKNDLVLNELCSSNEVMDTTDFSCVENIDLKDVQTIDSAGLAYLAQLKILHPKLSFSGYPKKIVLLSKLYGLSFLFGDDE